MIRPTAAEDLPHLEGVIDAVELFPSDMLAGMLAPYLSGDGTQDQWLTCEEGAPLGVAYFVPERLTDRTWNLLLIAVHPIIKARVTARPCCDRSRRRWAGSTGACC